ncbi:phage terminase large subunit [Vibrio campbellii]|uniref:phage terminase large subunit n=1 Tax=Vibrio campbellii TaxID=680 RepID=UPI001F351E72|nr:phage terminase large subunit [Vibrio campbellii]MCE7729628.1 phage terminase large subunit [Vibrio campbellii]
MKAPFSRLSEVDRDNMRDKANAAVAHQMSKSQQQKEAEQKLAQEKREEKARRRRRARAKADFSYFCKTYMPHAFTCDAAPYQKALSRIVASRTMKKKDCALFKKLIYPSNHGSIVMPENGRFDGILDLEPRDHGKTTRNTKALPMWLLLNFPEQYVIIGGASGGSIKKSIAAIRNELENNELIINDYGTQKKHGNTWTKSQLVLANGNALEGVGRGQAIRGATHGFLRPTACILDDVITDSEKNNKEIRDKSEDWFDSVILPLGQDMLIVVANTIMHHDDLPSRLLARIREGLLPDWLGLVFSALTPSGYPLFPSKWPLKALYKRRRQMRKVWWAEYMNMPRSRKEQDFQSEWFQHYELSDLDIRDIDIMMAVDPATGLETGDYSAIGIVGRHRITMTDYVLFCDGWHESDLKFARRIVEMYQWIVSTFNKEPKKILFEEVAFQKIYKKEVLRYAKSYGVRLPITGYKPSGNKKQRIKSLSSDVEAGGIQFLEKQVKLKTQLEEFPRGHDDCPDTIEMCCSEFETKQFVGSASPNMLQNIKSAARRFAKMGRGATGRVL